MVDREKVIKGLEACLPPHDPDCDLCPYDSIDLRCRAKLRNDVMALLKEQELVKPKKENRYIDFDGEGHPYNPETYDCGACGKELPWKVNYCPECGREVNWE